MSTITKHNYQRITSKITELEKYIEGVTGNKVEVLIVGRWDEMLGDKPSVQEIIEMVGHHFDISPRQLFSKSRTTKETSARFMCYKLIRKIHPHIGLKTIGLFFNRDHSTVINGLQQFDNFYEREAEFIHLFNRIETSLKNPLNYRTSEGTIQDKAAHHQPDKEDGL